MERSSSYGSDDGDGCCEWYKGSGYGGGRRKSPSIKYKSDEEELRDYDSEWSGHSSHRSLARMDTRVSQKSKRVERSWSARDYDDDNGGVDYDYRVDIRAPRVKVLSQRTAFVGQRANSNDNSEIAPIGESWVNEQRAKITTNSNGAQTCREMPIWAKFYLDILLHISLLMIVLTTLFFTIIVPAERKALHSELSHGIESVLNPLLAPNSQLSILLNGVQTSTLERAIKGFQTPTFYITDINTRLETQAITMCFILSFMFIASYIALRYSCGFCREIYSLIFENLLTFAFVGIIEFLFFTNIALHYVPTLPSFLVQSILDETLVILKTIQ
jgi:hypothetical protein